MRGFHERWRDVPDFILRITKGIWEDREIGSLRAIHAPGLIVRPPASVVIDSSGVIAARMATLAALLPSAAVGIERVAGRRADPLTPPRAAVRWSLAGRHDGWGAFGRPSGAEIYVIGITQAEFGPHGLRREWTLIGETAIWKQILLATGDLQRLGGWSSRCAVRAQRDVWLMEASLCLHQGL